MPLKIRKKYIYKFTTQIYKRCNLLVVSFIIIIPLITKNTVNNKKYCISLKTTKPRTILRFMNILNKYHFAMSALIFALFAVPAANAECVITGCNSEICSDIVQPHFGACEWKLQYQCYQEFGVCAAGEDGNCGWVSTPQLEECLSKLQQQIEGSSYMPNTSIE
jgi:hypothetical protein